MGAVGARENFGRFFRVRVVDESGPQQREELLEFYKRGKSFSDVCPINLYNIT